ncbi:MAG TPA: PAS domain-containing sensor histidine kinase [Roseiarcus sp.]|nr:PAS domain-containing sensor histidine kinase [Roseiarcus sp.]
MTRRAKGEGAVARSDESRSVGRFGPAAVAAALALSIFTFVVFAGFTPVIPTRPVVLAIFSGNAVLIVILLALIALETRKVISARRAGRAGARLHSRVVALFSLVAAVPALVTAVVATVSLERGLNPVFMEDIRSFIGKTTEATHLYRESQCRSLLRDAELTASDLSQSANLFQTDRSLFHDYLNSRAKFLNFSVAVIMKSNGAIEDRADESDPRQIAKPAPADFQDAQKEAPLCLLLADGKTFIALRPISGIEDSYLYVGRPIDPFSESFSRDAAEVVSTYDLFDAHRRNIEIGFGVMFILLALTMLLAAIWLGLAFANQLVAPIRRLIRAADEVASGNLYVQVPTRRSEGDLGHLGETFNKMTQELSQQQNRLIAANSLNDERRAFTEAVLAGVPAGVIGVDGNGVITVRNAAADRLLAPIAEPAGLIGVKLESLLPEVGPILQEAREGRLRLHQGQAKLQRDGRDRVLNVRVTSNPQRPDQGVVVTLDDISDLITAQRTAAWADVARRIAHEIKNPLTPIQLSAERLKRRYGKLILEGRDVFDQCTETIIRQVDDIKRMVDEFSSFARMPKALPARDDLVDCVRQVLFLMRVGRPEIALEDNLPAAPLFSKFDRRLMSQALTNVIKNAGEGIDAIDEAARGQGRIVVDLQIDHERRAIISVSDNGKGFPAEDRHKLMEPYVTTRAEGTGLGLPIVIKILEDHGGAVELLDGLERIDGGRGAQVRLILPIVEEAKTGESEESRNNQRALLN